MSPYSDLTTPNAEELDSQSPGTRLDFQNAYRLKKKSLISEIERSLGFSLHDVAPGLATN